ncbi:LysE family translocator [Leeia sp.]|uniref:LysE family translocator n=1 Tax=Leeia sp. TaxID=2884678 RepID=UPI0035AE5EDE
MEWQLFLLAVGTHFLALLSPGPDFFLLLNTATSRGVRAGLWTTLGITLANAMYVAMAALGVRGLESHTVAYVLLYWGGVVYLLWLSHAFLTAGLQPVVVGVKGVMSGGERRAFLLGFSSGMLNPKNGLFYAALFAALDTHHASDAVQLTAAIWMPSLVLAWDACVVWLFTRPRVVARFNRYQAVLHKLSAVVILGMALAMAYGFWA